MTYEEALAVATANNEIDENQTFLIDKNLRTVTIPDKFVLGVFNDKNVQIVPFAMPRFYNGIDMSTFAIQINYVNSNGDGDIYLVFEPEVQEELILFNWMVDRNAFATAGKTGFVVCMKEDDENGYVAREFNTTIAYAPVLEGLEIENPIDEQTALDILTQIQRAAERADIAAQQAEDSAAQASTDANTASDAASSATSSAATATAAQTSASASATSATSAETNALAYRNAAAASAAEAAAVVTDIEDVLSFPNALVVESATSEDIVTIEDGADDIPMQSVVAEITPVQDLNGQANPYPPGGGKNLFYHMGDLSSTVNGVTCTFNSDAQTITISGTNTGTAAFIVLSIPITVDLPRETALCRAFIGAPSYVYINLVYRKNGAWIGVNNGNVIPTEIDEENRIIVQVGIYASATTIPQTVMRVEIEKGSTAPTDWSPYSNICPISGRTGMTVSRVGKNLLYTDVDQYSNSGITIVKNADGSYTLNGTATAQVDAYLDNVDVAVPNGEYLYNGITGGSPQTYRIYLSVRKGNSTRYIGTNDGDASVTLTDETIRAFVRIFNGAVLRDVVIKPMLRPATITDDTYEPYTAQTYPITWESIAGTVYGGTLDVVSGVLTVTHASYDLAALNWSSSSPSNHIFRGLYPTVNVPEQPSSSVPADAISSDYTVMAYSPISGSDNGKFALGNGRFIIIDFRYSTIPDFVSHAADIQMVAKLATPKTYQLTPTEVRTLLGVNNVWSDGDSMTAKYRADLKLYIDKKIAEAIA